MSGFNLYRTLLLSILVIPIFYMLGCVCQGIKGEGVKKVTGYISDSIVLRSDADTSWHLNNIRWSIHDNFTYIAILQGEDMNIELWPLFKGRLELNRLTGDLTIKNISSSDALNYRVDLIGKDPNKRMTSFVQLSVQERLGKPSIHLRQMILHSGYCTILLGCSLNNKTSLSWKPEIGFNEPFWSGPQQYSGESMLWASFTPNRVVNFSCIATDGSHTESCHKSVRCTEPEPCINNTQNESHQVIFVRSNDKIIAGFIGFMVGVAFGYIGFKILQLITGGDNRPVDSSPSDEAILLQGGENGPVDSSPSDAVILLQGGENGPVDSSPSDAVILLQGGDIGSVDSTPFYEAVLPQGGENGPVDSSPSDEAILLQENATGEPAL